MTEVGGWFSHASAVILMAVLAFSRVPWFRRKAGTSEPGDRFELQVTGMKCSHCAESVKRALSECVGVRTVEVDAASGRAVVVGEHLNPEHLVAEVMKLGYGVKSGVG